MTIINEKKASQNTAVSLTSYTEIARIHRNCLAKSKGSLVITSTDHNEGSTLTAQLIARRNAETGKRTLLVDLNVYKQDITTSEQLTSQMWDLFSRKDNDNFTDIIVPAKGCDNLFILPAPSDDNTIDMLKDPKQATRFFDIIERNFDHVIVDTTPISATNRRNADAVILASAARRCTVVTMAGVTKRQNVKNAVKSLREAGANVEGLIVNDYKNPTAKSQLQAIVNLFVHIAPSFHDWLTYRIQKSTRL
jgi:Mrp family chromosome partitioning ATPase